MDIPTSDNVQETTSNEVQKTDENKSKPQMPDDLNIDRANNGSQQPADPTVSNVVNQVQVPPNTEEVPNPESANSPPCKIINLGDALDPSNIKSAELLNYMKVSDEANPNTEEKSDQASTSSLITAGDNATVPASNITRPGSFGTVQPMAQPTIIQFRTSQTSFRQEHRHLRKMRLFPSVRCYANYEGIFRKINLYDAKDSVKVFDSKVDHLIKAFKKDCTNRVEVFLVLRLIFNHCLHNIKFAKNVAPFFCSVKFYLLQLHGIKITRKFFFNMQYAFLESSSIRSENKQAFYNAISFTGDCYNRLMLLFTNPYHLENYLIEYLQMLLESPNETEIKMFTVEVYRNGKNLCQKYWIKMSHLFLQLRNFQVYNTSISFNSKVWIMLALDLYTYSYELPKDLIVFYKEYLQNEIFDLVKMPERKGYQYLIPMETCDTDPEEPLEI